MGVLATEERIDQLVAINAELLCALEWAMKNLAEVALPAAKEQGRVTSLSSALTQGYAAIAKAKGEDDD